MSEDGEGVIVTGKSIEEKAPGELEPAFSETKLRPRGRTNVDTDRVNEQGLELDSGRTVEDIAAQDATELARTKTGLKEVVVDQSKAELTTNPAVTATIQERFDTKVMTKGKVVSGFVSLARGFSNIFLAVLRTMLGVSPVGKRSQHNHYD